MMNIASENYEKIDVTAPQSTNHKIFHQMLISVALTFTVYCFYYHFKRVYAPAFVMAFGVMVMCPVSYYLNRAGKNSFARFILLASCHLYIYLTSLIFDHRINNDVYSAPAFLMAMVFFDLKNPRYFFAGLTMPFMTWAMIKFTPFIKYPLPINLNDFNFDHLNHLNFIGSAGMTLTFVTIMIRSSRDKDYRIKIEQEAKKQVKIALDEKTKIDIELNKAIKQLNEFFETSPDLMGIGRPDGYFKSVNPSFCRVLGYTEEELKSKPFLSLVHPDDISKSKVVVKKIIQGEPILNFENRCRCKDGTYKTISWSCQHTPGMTTVYGIGRDMSDLIQNREDKEQLREQLEEAQQSVNIGSWNYHVSTTANGSLHWIEACAQSKIGNDGRVVEVSGTFQDVTDLVSKENEIQERQKFLEAILENIPSVIFVKDKKKNYAYYLVNKAAQKFFKLPLNEVIGKNDYQLFERESADRFRSADEETIKLSGSIQNQTDTIPSSDGLKTVSTQKLSIPDENGEHRYGNSRCP